MRLTKDFFERLRSEILVGMQDKSKLKNALTKDYSNREYFLTNEDIKLIKNIPDNYFPLFNRALIPLTLLNKPLKERLIKNKNEIGYVLSLLNLGFNYNNDNLCIAGISIYLPANHSKDCGCNGRGHAVVTSISPNTEEIMNQAIEFSLRYVEVSKVLRLAESQAKSLKTLEHMIPDVREIAPNLFKDVGNGSANMPAIQYDLKNLVAPIPDLA